MKKGIIVPEKLLRKLQKRADFEKILIALGSRKAAVIILTKDVQSVVSSVFGQDKTMFPNFCIFRYEKNISPDDFNEVLEMTKAAPEKTVFISSDQKDFDASRKAGISRNYLFSSYPINVKAKPYKTIDRSENIIQAITNQ